LKKKISLFIALLSLLTSPSVFPKSATYEKEIEKRLPCPSNFLSNPPLYFYCIYRDYHNHKYDGGIEKAQRALRELEPLYKENPKGIIPNAETDKGKLKDPHVYKAVSDLHMLLGMLYYQKATNLKEDPSKKYYRDFFTKFEKKGFDFVQINELFALYSMKKLFPDEFDQKKAKRYKELLSKMGVTEKELDELMAKAQKAAQEQNEKRLSYLKKAVEELQKAVEVDPENALAYYQLGNFYSGALGENLPEDSEAAAEAYYKAALILKKKGDKEAYQEVLKKLKLLSSASKYLKLLEKENGA
jgi:predicted Zn-dependent protease